MKIIDNILTGLLIGYMFVSIIYLKTDVKSLEKDILYLEQEIQKIT